MPVNRNKPNDRMDVNLGGGKRIDLLAGGSGQTPIRKPIPLIEKPLKKPKEKGKK